MRSSQPGGISFALSSSSKADVTSVIPRSCAAASAFRLASGRTKNGTLFIRASASEAHLIALAMNGVCHFIAAECSFIDHAIRT